MIIISPLIRLALKIASIVLFVVTLAAAFGGKVNPDYMALPSVLVLAKTPRYHRHSPSYNKCSVRHHKHPD